MTESCSCIIADGDDTAGSEALSPLAFLQFPSPNYMTFLQLASFLPLFIQAPNIYCMPPMHQVSVLHVGNEKAGKTASYLWHILLSLSSSFS